MYALPCGVEGANISAESDTGGSGSKDRVARIHDSLSDLVMLHASLEMASVPSTGTTVPEPVKPDGAAVGTSG